MSDRDGAVSGSGQALVEIYRMNGDGVENLSNHPAQYYDQFHLSPDG